MMMHLILKVVLIISIIALTFFNRCSTRKSVLPQDFSLQDEIDEGYEAMKQIQEVSREGIQCSGHLKGLNRLKKQVRCCTNPEKRDEEDSKCDGEGQFDICLRGIELALRYLPFFSDEFKEFFHESVIHNVTCKLQHYNMTFKERLGQCISFNENDTDTSDKTYRLSYHEPKTCHDKQSMLLEGVDEWSDRIIEIYEVLNSTINQSNETSLASRCKKESKRRKRARQEQKQIEKVERKKRRDERKLMSKEERKRQRKLRLAQRSDATSSSSPLDCI